MLRAPSTPRGGRRIIASANPIRDHRMTGEASMSAKRVAVIVGSLRRDSLSRKLALNVLECARGRLDCHLVEIGDLPLYNEDLEGSEPAAWRRFRADVSAASAVLFVTPEYNRSIPGVLKNAVDVGSRPPGKSVFKGKPAAVISQTPHK